jgi:hypothetical protein
MMKRNRKEGKKSDVYNIMYATAPAPAPNTRALNHAMSRRVAPPVEVDGADADALFEDPPLPVDLERIIRNYKENNVVFRAHAGFVPVPDTLPVGLTTLEFPLGPVLPVELVGSDGPVPLKSSRPAAVTVPVGPGAFR